MFMNTSSKKQTLTTQRKAEINKAVKKTVKQYKKTLDLLAST